MGLRPRPDDQQQEAAPPEPAPQPQPAAEQPVPSDEPPQEQLPDQGPSLPKRAVRALVGSCDFFSVEDQGQVDGATSPRSPGSALKPFTYALAFERGICTPSSVVPDVPSNFTGYEPENYDRLYRGPVSAREALTQSLNIPAVTLLKQVGPQRLYGQLRELGLTTLTRSPQHYGLSLTLGSAEVTLLELAGAYATLARLGVHKPYRLLETDPAAEGRRVLSETACYLISDILSKPGELEELLASESATSRVRMAWKTGTSYGHRDAWTIAYTPDYTVGVWLGNFSGEPARRLVGIEAAAPVAARIIQQLHAEGPGTWYKIPDSVGTQGVCTVSGMPPGDYCTAEVSELYVKGLAARQTCAVHVAARIDAKTGTRLCAQCAKGRKHTVAVVESWPQELAAWFRRREQARVLIPEHFRECPAGYANREGSQIISPVGGQSYVLMPKDSGPPQKVLFRATSPAKRLYWFVDGMLLASVDPSEQVFWSPGRGTHTVVCSDDSGRSSRVAIDVR